MPAAVFDLDGTLLRSSELDDACYTDALKSVYGDIFPDHIDYGAEPEFTDEALARSVPGRFGAEVTDQTLRAHHDAFIAGLECESRRSPERCVPIAGAAELLPALLDAGWSLGIATGSWRRSAEIKLTTAGLPVSNVTVVTSSDHARRVGMIRKAIACLGENEAVYIGDGPWDGKAAAEVGAGFVGVTAGGGNARALSGAGAHAVIEDFQDTARVIETLTAALGKTAALP